MQYRFTEETKVVGGRILHRIQSEQGTLGGFIESEENLSHDGEAWVHESGTAYDSARVVEDAQVFGTIHGYAAIRGRAELHGEAFGSAVIGDDARVFGTVAGNAAIFGNTVVAATCRVD